MASRIPSRICLGFLPYAKASLLPACTMNTAGIHCGVEIFSDLNFMLQAVKETCSHSSLLDLDAQTGRREEKIVLDTCVSKVVKG